MPEVSAPRSVVDCASEASRASADVSRLFGAQLKMPIAPATVANLRVAEANHRMLNMANLRCHAKQQLLSPG
jgi:hypothetical protein